MIDAPNTTRETAAIRTLERLGYTHTGGAEWRPPLGPKPDFDLLDARDAEIGRLRAEVTIGRVAYAVLMQEIKRG